MKRSSQSGVPPGNKAARKLPAPPEPGAEVQEQWRKTFLGCVGMVGILRPFNLNEVVIECDASVPDSEAKKLGFGKVGPGHRASANRSPGKKLWVANPGWPSTMGAFK